VGETKLSTAALKKSIELAPAPGAPYVGIAEAALEQISPASSTN
jgi:hypothetical protein